MYLKTPESIIPLWYGWLLLLGLPYLRGEAEVGGLRANLNKIYISLGLHALFSVLFITGGAGVAFKFRAPAPLKKGQLRNTAFK